MTRAKTLTVVMFLGLTSLVAVPASARHESWEGGYRIEMADDGPTQGQQVYFRLVWRNEAKKSVRVPSGLWDKASITGDYCSLSGCRRSLRVAALNLKSVPANKLKWEPVYSDGERSRLASLAEFFPKACKGGCKTGIYWLSVERSWPKVTGLADDQVVPETFSRFISIQVNARQLPVRSPAAVKVTATFGKPKGNTLPVRVAVTNMLKVPMWFAKHSDVLGVDCDMRYVGINQPGRSFGFSGNRRYDESQATVLQPGKAQTFKGTCDIDADAYKNAKAVFAKVSVGPHGFYRFELERSRAAVHYFDAMHRTRELKVR